ncbi:type II secretion system GspH family protein [Undibacterium sp. Jales W-56]|uniref:type II secretion system protein n=1 Tax=Undibacterium sp. Jales W-56 TaxID=2897325 RepID=UPI0021D28205|nr:type II secretion system protein [Undibacterium sp. Jales W-56]MCU6432694.1 type II secretion system GspH family protein [Undibacterium sp. Jales W-56]
MTAAGFTLIEMIMVLLLVGILSVTLIPRFTDKKTFDARGFFDQSRSMVRYAQKVAIAQRKDVFVRVDSAAGDICLLYISTVTCANAVLADAVLNPADQKKFIQSAPSGISFTGSALFSFNALGKPNFASTLTLGVTGDGSTRTMTIESDTGYVH